MAGRIEEAMQHAARALEISQAQQERGYEAHALRLLGEIAAHPDSPDAEQAEARYRQALALAEELGMRPLVAHCHLGLGTLYRKSGRSEQARAELATAIDLYRAMEMTFWLTRAEEALTKVEGR
jgi:tetratricopeptide (TPR) repeat protein